MKEMVHSDYTNVDNLCVCVLCTHNKVFLSYKPADGKRRKGEFSLQKKSVNTQSKGKSNSELNSGPLSFSTQHAL